MVRGKNITFLLVILYEETSMMNTFYDIFFINSIFMTEKYFFWITF